MSKIMDKMTQLVDRSGLVFTLITEQLPEQTFAVVDFTLHEALSTPFRLEAALTCKSRANGSKLTNPINWTHSAHKHRA